MSTCRPKGFGFLLFSLAALWTTSNVCAEVELISAAGYLTGVPYLVRVEVRDNSGARDWNLWNAEAVLASDAPGVTLSANRIPLKNGLGTALVTISGSADFTLTAIVNGERSSRTVRNLARQPTTTVRGTLPGASTTWSGLINVVGDITVPTGHTLTIQPDALVLIDGVASGESGIVIHVNGAIQTLGTELNPVTITCSNGDLNWGQIRHANAQPTSYRHTFLSKAGRAPGEGHTGTGPALRLNASTVAFEGCVLSDLTASGGTIGKIMMADGSNLTFRNCVLARARMGPEIAGTELLCTDSYVMEMRGPDDADGIYLHSAGGRPIALSGCVIAGGDDDAVDTLDSTVAIENCIIRDWLNPAEDAKGVSVFNGEVSLRRALIANCYAGIAAKSSGPPAVVRMDHCTLSTLTQGVSAATKSNASEGNIEIYLTNSIVRSAESLHSDFGPEKFVSVTYSVLSGAWPGAGNVVVDPLFVNSDSGDFHLQPRSPALDAGDPAFPRDADGTRTDIGFYAPQAQSKTLFIRISSPASGAVFIAPAAITISATVDSATANVARVEFFADGRKLGEALTSPFTFVWSGVPAGNYVLTAVARDATGLSLTAASSVVSITVSADVTPPSVADHSPTPGSVAELTEVRVTFTEAVTGVDASDMLINGLPATKLSGSGAGPYTFSFVPPPQGAVGVRWSAAHGIRDLSGNPFEDGGWNYLLGLNQVGVVINEIMYHPASENPAEEFVELFNRGASPVNVKDWRLSKGADFVFPKLTIPEGGYLVVAANAAAFRAKYPDVTNVIGNWSGSLSNSRESIDLVDSSGTRVDTVRYADEGDWAIRRRGPTDLGFRGWVWFAGHDGLGKSLEVLNPAAANDNGQNWASSLVAEGTPGRPNSVLTNNIAPLIQNVTHFPIVPKSTEPIQVTAKISDESGRVATAALSFRASAATPPPFASTPMWDDGTNGDIAAGDGIFSAIIPAQTNLTVVEFYVNATDALGSARTWPAPAIAAEDGAGPAGQVANAIFQVDDTAYAGSQPLYKIILTESERTELALIPSQSTAERPNSQMNCTFISADGTGVQVHYLAGVRNRGHGSRRANPPNYRVNFRSDDPWKGVTGINLNSQQIHMQHFGSSLAIKAGLAGTYSQPVQVRVNGANRAAPGGGMFGSYVANEVYDADWADRHVPFDSEGNLYKAVRDIRPPNFDFRGPASHSYTNTYFKETNASEDDWSDLIAMLRILGENSGDQFTLENIRQVINVEQWLAHLAFMNLLANGESGLNTGNNDDYFMYRGVTDRRFILLYHDLDQILGQPGSLASNTDIYRATCCPISGDSEGAWRAMTRFLRSPDFEPLYHAALSRLLETTFSKPQFDALIDQTLGSYVPQTTINAVKTWMDARRNFVRSQLPKVIRVPAPAATVSGWPRSPTPKASAALSVSGEGVTHYRFSLNQSAFGPETPIDTPIQLTALAAGTNSIAVIGRNAAGDWQTPVQATTRAWNVNPGWPTVRLNEILAHNEAAVNQNGRFPDLIELFNEGDAPVSLAGFRLTDRPDSPNKFSFPAGSTLAPGAHLVLDGSQLGFNLGDGGGGVYLFQSAANGGALLDSVEFGLQIADLSIGRIAGSGEWQLAKPTFGSANVPSPLGDSRQLKINEWLTSGLSPYPDDFVELYNPESLPVAMGDFYLTDQSAGAPTRSRISRASFIPAKGFAVFSSGKGNSPAEINFALASEMGEIALLAPDLTRIDSVIYGQQKTGVASGRCPDGETAQKTLDTPTPGGPNQCPSTTAPPQTLVLMPFNHVWKYEASGTDLGAAWKNPDYDDAAWKSGPGVLGFENSPLAQPLLTSFPNASNSTYYVRTRFTVPAGLAAATVRATHLVDDGAAFYLNGREVGRFNLAANATYQTYAAANLGDATIQTFSIPPSELIAGTNDFAVEVHQINRTSSDIVIGLQLEASIASANAAEAGVLINEVLAWNATLTEPDGSRPDWVELYNPSASTVDLTNLSLTDDAANPRRWIFPKGSLIPAKGFLKVRLDPAAPASVANAAFGLNANGGAVLLFDRPADGGGLRNAVTYGLQAADWSIGRMPDGGTNWVLNIPTLGAANRAAPLGNPLSLKINEWMADPASGADWFEIFNPNSAPVEISRYWVSDNLSDRLKNPLPPLSFIGSGAFACQKFEADENPQAGADHVNFKLSGTGESLAIADATGALIDGVRFGPQVTGVSQGRLPDGSANIATFALTPTPGSSNFLPIGGIVISELLSHSDPPLMDAVELQNVSPTSIDIGGWFLSDSGAAPRKFRIPPNTVIPAGGFVVFYEDQFNRPGGIDEPFSFSSVHGEEVFLSQAINGALTGYRASVAFGPAENGVSFGRFPTSQGFHFVPMERRTLGKDNPATTNEFRLGAGALNSYAKVGPIVISEIMYHPAGTNEGLEFVELHNLSAAATPLFDRSHTANTWRFRKGIDFDFPPGASIPSGGYLVIVGFDPRSDLAALAAFQKAYGAGSTLIGPYRGKLRDSSDSLELLKPDPPQTLPGPEFGLVPYIVVDRIDYADATPWPTSADGTGQSLQKISATLYGNDPVNWTSAPPNPGAPGVAAGDSDNDGLPNDWEIANGLNPNDPSDAAADPDGDGLSNRQEFFAGTNPRNAASVLRATVRLSADGGITLEFLAMANRTYAVESRESLALGAWERLTEVVAAPSERFFQWPIKLDATSRFYRVVALQP